MIGFAYQGGEEDKLALFVFSTDQIAGILSAGAASPVSCDFSGEYWNRNIISLMTTGGKTYGAGIGTSQPGQCLYFNKRVLTDAGIDWQNLYDLQAAGEWTWDTFEQVLKQIRDSGTADTAPLGGSSDDLYQIAVLSCGGSFIGAGEDGTPFPAADSDRTKNALAWAKKLWNTYSAAKPEGASWNWSSEVWLEGKIAFYVGRITRVFPCLVLKGFRMNVDASPFRRRKHPDCI